MGKVAVLCLTVCLAAMLPSLTHAACSSTSWRATFSKTGLSKCSGSNRFINGFYRNSRRNPDHLNRLEEASCCTRPRPWSFSGNLVVHADWWKILDSHNRWGRCPDGYFLNGIYRNEDNAGWLHNIEEGRCVRPSNAPRYYGSCYNHNVGSCFNNKGWCKCNEGFFVTGVFRSTCDELHCLAQFRCCKPAPREETLDDLFKVKTYVMDISLRDMALLAHYLGYGWCAGCRSKWVGDDFVRSGDSWLADKSRRCSGYKSDHRLSLRFADWSFGTKEIAFGQRVVEDLTPETVDDGIISNNDDTEATKTITRSEDSVRTVTHTTTSAWKVSQELGIEITYTPSGATGGVGGSVSYKFGYETSSTITDSTENQQTKTFTVSSSKTLGPYSSVRWQLVLSRTRSTLPYTAKILVRFSTELRGFLRWGGGSNSISTNYHHKHKGSGDRPTVNYKFGDARTPFYTALDRQSSTGQRPWLWYDLQSARPGVKRIIRRLTSENRYTITLTGKFEDVIGKQVHLTWDEISQRGRSSSRNSTDTGSIGGNSTDVSGRRSKIVTKKAGRPPAPNPLPPNSYKPEEDESANTEIEENPSDL